MVPLMGLGVGLGYLEEKQTSTLFFFNRFVFLVSFQIQNTQQVMTANLTQVNDFTSKICFKCLPSLFNTQVSRLVYIQKLTVWHEQISYNYTIYMIRKVYMKKDGVICGLQVCHRKSFKPPTCRSVIGFHSSLSTIQIVSLDLRFLQK